MFISEYWTAGHPDDMHDDDGEGFEVTAVSEDEQRLIGAAKAELNNRFVGEEFELRVIPYDDRFPDTHFAVQMRYDDDRDDDDAWVAYFLIHPVEVL